MLITENHAGVRLFTGGNAFFFFSEMIKKRTLLFTPVLTPRSLIRRRVRQNYEWFSTGDTLLISPARKIKTPAAL